MNLAGTVNRAGVLVAQSRRSPICCATSQAAARVAEAVSDRAALGNPAGQMSGSDGRPQVMAGAEVPGRAEWAATWAGRAEFGKLSNAVISKAGLASSR